MLDWLIRLQRRYHRLEIGVELGRDLFQRALEWIRTHHEDRSPAVGVHGIEAIARLSSLGKGSAIETPQAAQRLKSAPRFPLLTDGEIYAGSRVIQPVAPDLTAVFSRSTELPRGCTIGL